MNTGPTCPFCGEAEHGKKLCVDLMTTAEIATALLRCRALLRQLLPVLDAGNYVWEADDVRAELAWPKEGR